MANFFHFWEGEGVDAVNRRWLIGLITTLLWMKITNFISTDCLMYILAIGALDLTRNVLRTLTPSVPCPSREETATQAARAI